MMPAKYVRNFLSIALKRIFLVSEAFIPNFSVRKKPLGWAFSFAWNSCSYF